MTRPLKLEDPAHETRPYSVPQLAARWDVSPSMVRKLIADGRLQSFKIGVLIRISAAEVERYEKCPAEPSPNPIPSSDSGEDLPSSGETAKKVPATGGNSPRQIGRAPKRKLASSGKNPTHHHGLRVVS